MCVSVCGLVCVCVSVCVLVCMCRCVYIYVCVSVSVSIAFIDILLTSNWKLKMLLKYCYTKHGSLSILTTTTQHIFSFSFITEGAAIKV